jgi:tetratricopeptide (TPR) repeat protein
MGQLSRAEFNTDLGRFDEALDGALAAVEAFEELADVWSVAWGNCTLGRVLTGSGRPSEAVGRYRSAIEVFEDRGDEGSRTTALIGLAEARVALGDGEGAREALGAALDYLRDHGDPRAEEVQARLLRLAADG